MYDIQGFATYMRAGGHADPLFDRDRKMPGVYFRGDHCSIALFCPKAAEVGIGIALDTVSFAKNCGKAPVHFFAREAVVSAIGMEEKIIVGRSVFWAKALACLLDHAPDDLVGVSFGVPARDRGTFKAARQRTLCLFGRTWYGAAAPTSFSTGDVHKRLVLRPMSLLTEVVRHVA